MIGSPTITALRLAGKPGVAGLIDPTVVVKRYVIWAACAEVMTASELTSAEPMRTMVLTGRMWAFLSTAAPMRGVRFVFRAINYARNAWPRGKFSDWS